MGVDCTAYERVTLVRACTTNSLSDDDWDAISEAGDLFLDNLPVFAARGDGMPEGIYHPTGKTLGWSSSYPGYGRFRQALCLAALHVEPEVVWDNYDTYAAQPFAPLIYFADNEGFLGPETCKRLAADAEVPLDVPGYDDAWKRWQAMFKLAAGAGVITYS